MLAGRAWQFFLFPFTHVELGERFNLDDVVLRGTLPPVIDESLEDGFRMLTAYVQTYLKKEIFDEAIVRNIGAFRWKGFRVVCKRINHIRFAL
jgi:predicted AAA+ superfamily ATPase